MRVYELGKEMGTGSQTVMAAAGKLGIAATAPASGLTDVEVVAIRGALAQAEGGDVVVTSKDESTAPDVASVRGYRLIRKGSVSAGGVRVRKGEVVDERVYGGLPPRVRGWFDRV